jgi:hypothetical protein
MGIFVMHKFYKEKTGVNHDKRIDTTRRDV